MNDNGHSERSWKVKGYNSEEKYNNMIEKLAAAERNNKLVIFVGAGVSISQGYPNWDGYVDHLIKYWQFNIQSLVRDSNVPRETILVFDKIAQGNYSNKRKIDLVHQVLKKILGKSFEEKKLEFEKYYFNKVSPFEPENSILASLSNLDATFITPNYDLEIEHHLERKRNEFRSVKDLESFENSDLYLRLSHILHIHGTAEGNPQWLINSSAAYTRQYFRQREHFEKLIAWFEDQKPVVLFIGVSLEEDELLSLLVEGNKNYALMKADEGTKNKVDIQLRSFVEEFFYEENFTEIFWYGDIFKDLTGVVDDIVTDIKKKNYSTTQEEYWNKLNTLGTIDSEYIDILNSMVNNTQNHKALNEYYDHIYRVKDQELIMKSLINSFKSDIIIDKSTYVPENFWLLLERQYHLLDDPQINLIKNLYTKETFDPRNVSSYNIFQKLSFEPSLREKIIVSLSNIEYIESGEFSKEPEVMAQWVINHFESGQSNEFFHVSDKNKVLFKFSQDRISRLCSVLQSKSFNRSGFYQISEMINQGIIAVFYKALKENRILFHDNSILDDFPDELLQITLIQKMLVYLSLSINLTDELIKRLITKINFDNRSFGSELNEFIENNLSIMGSINITHKGNYRDAISKFQPLEDKSFISAEDVLEKNESELTEKLLSEKDYFDDDYQGRGNDFKTVNATMKFIMKSLQEDDNVSEKISSLLINNSDMLFERFENLYFRIATDNNLHTGLIDEAIQIYLQHIDLNKYTSNYDSFFTELLVNRPEIDESIKAKFLDINIDKLGYTFKPDKLLDTLQLMSSELGSYIWNLVELVKIGMVESKSAKEKVLNIENCRIKNFAEGALFREYDQTELDISQDTFIGFCNFNSQLSENEIILFKDIVIALFETDKLPLNLEIVPFIIALTEINPENIRVGIANRYYIMIKIIFKSKKQFKFEKQWLKWILKNDVNGTFLNEIASIFSLKSVSLDKIHDFLRESDQYIREGHSKASLAVFNHNLKEENLVVDKRQYINLILKLLNQERIRTDFLFINDLEKLMDFLDHAEKIALKNIPYVKTNLTQYDKEKLKNKL